MAGVAAAQVPALAPMQELEPILVLGERPGPALWKVTYRDHELWLLPTMTQLSQRVVWRSSQLEDVLSRSQEVYFEASLVLHLGGNDKDDTRVLDALLNPDGKWVRDILPPDLHALFARLNARYAGNDQRLETFRPFYAAMQLREQAFRRLQLDGDGQVHDQVAFLARRYFIPLRLLGREISPGAGTLAARLRRIAVQADVDCASSQLYELESDLRQAVVRANAWSTGDIDALRADWAATRQRDQLVSCKPLFRQLAPRDREVRQTRDQGFRALERALRRNRSTVALVMLEEVFDPDGVVARMRAAGYQVEEP